jgi:hypothetical protein
MVAPTLARADITGAQCYGTLEYRMRCDDDSGCEETVTIPTCIPGNVGSLSTGRRTVLLVRIHDLQRRWGVCGTGDAKRAESSVLPSRALSLEVRGGGSDPSPQDLARHVIFVPDRCARSYGAIDLESIVKRGA